MRNSMEGSTCSDRAVRPCLLRFRTVARRLRGIPPGNLNPTISYTADQAYHSLGRAAAQIFSLIAVCVRVIRLLHSWRLDPL